MLARLKVMKKKKHVCLTAIPIFLFFLNHYPCRSGFKRDGDDAITLAPRRRKQPQKNKKSLCFTSLHFDGKHTEVNVRARLFDAMARPICLQEPATLKSIGYESQC